MKNSISDADIAPFLQSIFGVVFITVGIYFIGQINNTYNKVEEKTKEFMKDLEVKTGKLKESIDGLENDKIELKKSLEKFKEDKIILEKAVSSVEAEHGILLKNITIATNRLNSVVELEDLIRSVKDGHEILLRNIAEATNRLENANNVFAPFSEELLIDTNINKYYIFVSKIQSDIFILGQLMQKEDMDMTIPQRYIPSLRDNIKLLDEIYKTLRPLKDRISTEPDKRIVIESIEPFIKTDTVPEILIENINKIIDETNDLIEKFKKIMS